MTTNGTTIGDKASPTDVSVQRPIISDDVACLARRIARSCVGQAGITRDDVPDIEQSLVAALAARLHKYDPRRPPFIAFATWVLTTRARNIIRDRRAGKRDYRRTVATGAFNSESESPALEFEDPSSNDAQRQLELQQDVASVLQGLPVDIRRILQMLQHDNITDVARKLGIPRSTLCDRIARFRHRFEDAGLRDYL